MSAAGASGSPAPPAAHCANCRTPLAGPYCHGCGQPQRTPVRELWSIVRDGLYELFDLDGKFFGSIKPLLFQPGVLTREYFGGRRFSFIRPLRLYLGVSLLLFLVISLQGEEAVGIHPEQPAPVEQALAAAAPAVELAGEALPVDVVPAPGSAPAATRDAPVAANAAVPEPAVPEAAATAAQRTKGRNAPFIRVGGKPWDPRTDAVDLPWTPQWLDDFINQQLVIMIENGSRLESDPKRLLRSALDYLPHSMFFLLPVFALLLKLLYVFRRRLYVEHLIVALHSHSFLFLGFLLILLSESLGSWVPALEPLLRWLRIALLVWMPVYLFIMQKRVYQQGWLMTSVKYSVMGLLYMVLIALTISLAFLLALRFLD